MLPVLIVIVILMNMLLNDIYLCKTLLYSICNLGFGLVVKRNINENNHNLLDPINNLIE